MHQLDTKLNWEIAGLYFGKFTVGGQSHIDFPVCMPKV